MDKYKADITLNEKDSLQDMLSLEKTLVKIYATALTEGVSQNFRCKVEENFLETAKDQLNVFLQMTEQGYYEVESVPEDELAKTKEKFIKAKEQMS